MPARVRVSSIEASWAFIRTRTATSDPAIPSARRVRIHVTSTASSSSAERCFEIVGCGPFSRVATIRFDRPSAAIRRLARSSTWGEER